MILLKRKAVPMIKQTKVTMIDVAEAAGVAVGTVSRVLNGAKDVSSPIQQRVLDKAKELNYSRLRRRKSSVPNELAAPNQIIGVVVFGMEDTLVQLPVVSKGLQGIESALAAMDRNLMLANIPNGDRVPPFLRDGSVAGVLLKGPNQGDLPSPQSNPLMRAILGVPHVWLMGRPNNATGDHCNFSTVAAGHLAVQHFQSRGHRRIAFFNPKPGHLQFESVKSSFITSSMRLGLEWSILEPELPAALHWPLPAITRQDLVDELLERWTRLSPDVRPTGLMVPSDRTAVQMYAAMATRGLKVAVDVSIISCNNERTLVSNLDPGLTTIDIHSEAIGRRAVDQLFWRIEHPREPLSVQVLIDPTLAERESVAMLSD